MESREARDLTEDMQGGLFQAFFITSIIKQLDLAILNVALAQMNLH